MTALASHVHAGAATLALTGPVPAGRMIRLGQVTVRVYDCQSASPYIARLGFGYDLGGEEHYYPISIGVSYPVGTPVQVLEEDT